MDRYWRLNLVVCALFAAGAGCDVEEGGPRDVELERWSSGGGGGYSGWGCRTCGYTNSPVLGTHPINEFYVGNAPPTGLGLVGIEDYNAKVYPVDFEGDMIVAYKGGQTIKGPALVGWKLIFADDKGNDFEVEIFNHEQHADWFKGHEVNTYALAYNDYSGGELQQLSLCPNITLDETAVTALVDETYDLASNEVKPTGKGWVTFACRGHALAKMKMLGYAPGDTYGSKIPDRQATIRMITADYCGSGHSFTQIGQPISWVDRAQHQPLDGGEDRNKIEALWDEDGAICLNTPRYAAIKDVNKKCGKFPACKPDLKKFSGGALWITIRN